MYKMRNKKKNNRKCYPIMLENIGEIDGWCWHVTNSLYCVAPEI